MFAMQIYKTDDTVFEAGTGAEEDTSLMRAAAAGDQDAFRRLMQKHMAQTVRLAMRMLGSVSAAEDIAQEAFIRVWKAAPNWLSPEQAGAKFTTWLYRIVMNLVIDEKRKSRSTNMDDATLNAIEDTSRSTEQRMIADEQSQRVKTALAALPERQRAAFTMSFYDDRSDKDIADILGISVKAVESLLVRARRSLREALKNEGRM